MPWSRPVRLLKARADYEKTQAEVRKMDRESEAQAEKTKQEAKLLEAKAREAAAEARIKLVFDSYGSVFDVSPLAMGRGSSRSVRHSATSPRDNP